MRLVSKLITIFVILAFNALALCDTTNDEYYKAKIIKNLNESSLWIIENGVETYKKSGKDAVFRKLLDDWGVQLWIEPWVETEDYLAQFRIKARGIHYQILNLYRKESEGNYYEYWVSKIVDDKNSGEGRRCLFYITVTNDIYGQRNIIYKSEQFIDSFKLPAGDTLRFPSNNLELLYILEAWEFPQNYLNSDLKDKVVLMDKNGKISLK